MSISGSDRASDHGPGGTRPSRSSRPRSSRAAHPEELREEIARTRQELADTVAALAGKTHLKRRAKAKARRTGANAMAKARDAAGRVRHAPGSVVRHAPRSVVRLAGSEIRRLGASARRIAVTRGAPSLARLRRADRRPGE